MEAFRVNQGHRDAEGIEKTTSRCPQCTLRRPPLKISRNGLDGASGNALFTDNTTGATEG